MAVRYRPQNIIYTRQPQIALPDVGATLASQLEYASAVPGSIAWSRRFGFSPPTIASTTRWTDTVTPYCGKSVAMTNAGIPLQYTKFTYCPAQPFSIMINMRWTTLSTSGTGNVSISMGGSGAGAGFMLDQLTSATGFNLAFGGVSATAWALPTSLVVNVDYTFVITINTTGATIYYRRKDNSSEGTQSATISGIGTINTAATRPLTLGAGWDNTSYFDGFAGSLGSFAIWSRELLKSEAYALVENPFQLWGYSFNLWQAIPAAAATGRRYRLATLGAGY